MNAATMRRHIDWVTLQLDNVELVAFAMFFGGPANVEAVEARTPLPFLRRLVLVRERGWTEDVRRAATEDSNATTPWLLAASRRQWLGAAAVVQCEYLSYDREKTPQLERVVTYDTNNRRSPSDEDYETLVKELTRTS